MNRDFGRIAYNKVEIKEGTVVLLPGVDTNISLQIDGVNTITNATMSLFQNNKDVSSTYLTGSADLAVNGRRITTQVFTGLKGGVDYTAVIYFKDGGVGTSRMVNVTCLKYGVNPSNYQQTDYLKYRLEESPIMILPGQNFIAKISVAGYGVISNVAMSVYKGTKDVTGDVLTGSMGISGREITLKSISGLIGGNAYLAYITFQDDGKNTWRYAELLCPKV